MHTGKVVNKRVMSTTQVNRSAEARTSTATAPARITEQQIKDFAAAWFRALDVHVPVEECTRFVAEADVEFVFPEKTCRGVGDFKAWYAGGDYSDGTSAPGVINIFFDETHNLQSVEAKISEDVAEVRVVVGWQASWFAPPAPKSNRTSLAATQQWRLRRSDKNVYGLEIVRYVAIAEPFNYAPGFAQL
jgi:hypothetical protein